MKVAFERYRQSVVDLVQSWLDNYGDERLSANRWDPLFEEGGMTSQYLELAKSAEDFGTLIHIQRDLAMDVLECIGTMLRACFPEITDEQIGHIPLHYDT